MAKGAVGTWSTKSVKTVCRGSPSTVTRICWLSPAACTVTCPRAFGKHDAAPAETTISNALSVSGFSCFGFFAAAAPGKPPRMGPPTPTSTANMETIARRGNRRTPCSFFSPRTQVIPRRGADRVFRFRVVLLLLAREPSGRQRRRGQSAAGSALLDSAQAKAHLGEHLLDHSPVARLGAPA